MAGIADGFIRCSAMADARVDEFLTGRMGLGRGGSSSDYGSRGPRFESIPLGAGLFSLLFLIFQSVVRPKSGPLMEVQHSSGFTNLQEI